MTKHINYLLLFLLAILLITCNSTEQTEPVVFQQPPPEEIRDSTMNEVLKLISNKAIILDDIPYHDQMIKSMWIGHAPATDEAIQSAEARLGISLPKHYLEFVRLTNGFEAASTIHPTFHPLEKIDYLKNVDQFQIDVWLQKETEEIGIKMQRSIIVAGIEEEQHFLLIPPLGNENWEYWSFAFWYPGEAPHKDLMEYWWEVNSFLDEEI